MEKFAHQMGEMRYDSLALREVFSEYILSNAVVHTKARTAYAGHGHYVLTCSTTDCVIIYDKPHLGDEPIVYTDVWSTDDLRRAYDLARTTPKRVATIHDSLRIPSDDGCTDVIPRELRDIIVTYARETSTVSSTYSQYEDVDPEYFVKRRLNANKH